MSSGFLSAPTLRPLFDGRTWVLAESFSYDVGCPDSGDRITVPAGFATDLTSTPWAMRWLVPRWGRHGPAAILHDFLYTVQTRTRREADRIFREAMLTLGTRPGVAAAAYAGVRVGGWYRWHRRRLIERWWRELNG